MEAEVNLSVVLVSNTATITNSVGVFYILTFKAYTEPIRKDNTGSFYVNPSKCSC